MTITSTVCKTCRMWDPGVGSGCGIRMWVLTSDLRGKRDLEVGTERGHQRWDPWARADEGTLESGGPLTEVSSKKPYRSNTSR